MKRRDFLSGLAVAVATAGSASAQGVAESVKAQLRAQGFSSVIEERTLLGRVRIVAQREDGLREIIINPRTGEILRDLWTPSRGGAAAAKIIGETGGSGKSGRDNSGKGGGDDGSDDDGDDGEDDESGGDDNGGGDDGESGGGDDGGDDDGEDGGGDDDGGDDGEDGGGDD